MSDFEIVPAILPESYDDLTAHLLRVRSVVRRVQIDVCDGIFVSHATWPYGDASHFKEIISQEEGMPLWEDFDFEIDMMVSKPDTHVSHWIDAGATAVIIHVDSLTAPIIDQISHWRERVEVGCAFSVTTPLDAFKMYCGDCDFFQCMGIERIGFQGQLFDSRVHDQISLLTKEYPSKIISVDGGVTDDTIKKLYECGARRFVSGSRIFKSLSVQEGIDSLAECIEK